MANVFIKGYCEDCHENISELDLAAEDGENILLHFICPKCGALWIESYEFTERKRVWKPPDIPDVAKGVENG